MTAMHSRQRFALTLLAVVLAPPVLAQETVLREGQVTEKALVDALTPPAAAASAADDGMRTRSFRPGVRPAAVAGTAAAAGAVAANPAGKASILVTFVTDSADLTNRARESLDVLAGAMKSERLASARFTIEGHADPRGGEEHNLRLSTARANAVREYLIARHGLPADRIAAVGKGSSALLNTTDVTAPENRRVTIVSQSQ
jgi:outer membrane protein OmpA-like peptidoglycan-associated protein